MIDRQLLAILREVDRLGSVTAAAGRLNVTQSALSHTIRKVEERHGITIWTKKGRGLRFTQAGQHLLALAQRVLPQFEHAERVLGDYAVGLRGALRVGMECHPCQKWLMRMTAAYLAHWPDVDFEVRTAFRFDGVAALLDSEIDLLITPDPVDLPEVLFTPVFDYELVLVVHDAHPLAARAMVLPQDLLDQELITVPVGLERLDVFTRFLVPSHCRPRRHRTVETTDLMLQLVAAGRGVTVLPDWLVREEAAGMPVRTLRLGPDGIAKSINLGIRRGDGGEAHIAGFLALARRMGH
ncbi:LysR family transcriptional regulator [Azospirillum picis]|uniref:LysR family transcriptional regulator for metE and metH n=1 Tax=Azospirillum picis TaxID=488438 RepID=A0ABU0MSK0_9PROT|nr:LysR family transcriptional regulator [Azospirillum picis]MBP2302717.1 LysR family transcriptional regulator for metE and metH [Azospirillum picis]MDQ0536468.1 LysR family transcriptional regulator for metE and metH [Azospirillum picis]